MVLEDLLLTFTKIILLIIIIYAGFVLSKRLIEKKKHKKIIHKSESKISKSISQNYWMIVSAVLFVLLIIVLLINSLGTSQEIGENVAGEKVINFIEAQGSSADLVGVSEKNGLYEVVISYQGQQIPVYVTKDGENLIPSLIPLTAQTTTNTNTKSNTQTSANIPKSDKPVIELFVMSHCPYGTQMEKGLLPVIDLLGDKIDFNVKFVYYAMHGEKEVLEQLNQYCIQKEQKNKYIDYLKCFLEDGNGDACLTQVGIDTTKLESCTSSADAEFKVSENLNDESSWLNGKFPKFDIYLQDNEKYNVAGSPTLIINGENVRSARDSASLLSVICGAFTDANIPSECSQTLSNEAPSSGFGFSTSGGSSSGSGAACGV